MGSFPASLRGSLEAAIADCHLSLTGKTILTEAATGPYVVTPVLAAMADAKHVFAYTKSGPYGSIEDVRDRTLTLAQLCGVAERISIVSSLNEEIVQQADIITNSGHLRPIDHRKIAWFKDGAVVPLMYEAWEFRDSDVDLEACRKRNIAFAGTNETHPAVNVFSFLGPMAILLLENAGLIVRGAHILLLCDNPFKPFLLKALTAAGAKVDLCQEIPLEGPAYQAVVVALTPKPTDVLSIEDLEQLASLWPKALVARFWGDLDNEAMANAKLRFYPQHVDRGHMGILPSALGFEPIVRLQCGGLKVGQILSDGGTGDCGFVQRL